MIERAPAEDAGLPPWATLDPGTPDAGLPDADWVTQHTAALNAMRAQMAPGDTGPAAPPPSDPRVDSGAPMPAWADDVGGAFSALGSAARTGADRIGQSLDPATRRPLSPAEKWAYGMGEESELASGGAQIARSGSELMANSFDVPEGAAGLLAQKAVHGITGVAGREELEAEKRMTGNPIADLGTVGAINREATGRAPAELQTAKAGAELATWLPGTARSLLRFAGGATGAARARVGFDPITREPVSVETGLDAQGRPANPLGAPPGEYGHQATDTQLGPGAAAYAKQPGPAPHENLPGATTIHAVDGTPITDIHPANVTPEAAAEIRDALKLGRVDPTTLPRTAALARQLNAVTPPTIEQHSPEALEARRAAAVKAEIDAQNQAMPNPQRDGIATIVLGPPGAGKNNVIGRQAQQGFGAQVLDLDGLASHFDGYNAGIGKPAVHAEADAALPTLVSHMADGRNLVIPLVGANPDRVRAMMEALRGNGYGKVYVAHVDIPTEQSVARVDERFTSGGIYLPHEYVANPALRERSLAAYNAVKGESNGYIAFNNDVPRGQAPTIREASAALPRELRPKRGDHPGAQDALQRVGAAGGPAAPGARAGSGGSTGARQLADFPHAGPHEHIQPGGSYYKHDHATPYPGQTEFAGSHLHGSGIPGHPEGLGMSNVVGDRPVYHTHDYAGLSSHSHQLEGAALEDHLRGEEQAYHRRRADEGKPVRERHTPGSTVRASELVDGDIVRIEGHPDDLVFEGFASNDTVQLHPVGNSVQAIRVSRSEPAKIVENGKGTEEDYADESGGREPSRLARRPSDLPQEEYLGPWDRHHDQFYGTFEQRIDLKAFANGLIQPVGKQTLIHVSPSKTGKGEIGFFMAGMREVSPEGEEWKGPDDTKILLAVPVDAHGKPTSSDVVMAGYYTDAHGSTGLGLMDDFKGRGVGPVFLAEAQKSLGRIVPGGQYTKQGEQNRRRAHRYDTIQAMREGRMGVAGKVDYTNDPEVMKASTPGGAISLKAPLGIVGQNPGAYFAGAGDKMGDVSYGNGRGPGAAYTDPNTVPIDTKAGPVTFSERGDAVGREYHATYYAHLADGTQVGRVSVAWERDGGGAIKMIEVPEKYRRQGIATALVKRVRAELEPGESLTALGDVATPAGEALMRHASIGGRARAGALGQQGYSRPGGVEHRHTVVNENAVRDAEDVSGTHEHAIPEGVSHAHRDVGLGNLHPEQDRAALAERQNAVGQGDDVATRTARLGPGAAGGLPPTGRGTFAALRPGMDVDRAGDKLIGKGLDGKLTAADAEELLRFIARRTDLPARAVGTIETRLEEIVAAQDENAAGVIQVRKEFKDALKVIRADVASARTGLTKAQMGLAHVGRDAMEQQRVITRQTARATTAAGRALQDRLAAASGQLATETAQAAATRDATTAAAPAVTGAHTNAPVEYGGAIDPKRPGLAENAAARQAHQAVVNAVQVKIDDSVRRLDALIKDDPSGAEAPAHKVATGLRRAAAAVNAEIAALPKRGLIGSRSPDAAGIQDTGMGSSSEIRQSEAQRNRPGELSYGSNSYRPTGARLGLERRRDQLLEAARAITDTRHELLLLDRQVKEADMGVADRIQASARRGELDRTMAGEYAAMARAGNEAQALEAVNRELAQYELPPIEYPDYTQVDALAEQRADAASRLAKALEQARAIAPLDTAGNMAELARGIAVELRNLRSALKAIEPPELTEVPPLSEYAKQRGILRQGPKYHPDTYALIQEAVDANPDEYARRLQTLTFDEAVNDLAPNIGLAPEKFRTMLAKRGELIGPAVAAKMAVELQAQRIALLARTEGRASDQYAVEYAKFVGLVMDVTEGVSEVARTLGAQRIYAQASTARAIDAAHFHKAAEAKYKAAAAAQTAYERALATAEEHAAIAAAKAEAAHGDALLRIAADELVRRQAALEQARMMAESGRRALEQATTAYEDAKANADTRAEAARQAIIAKAVKAGISPDHVKVLGSFSPYEVEGMARYLGSVKPMLGGEMIYSSLINSMLSAPTSVIKHLNGTLFLQVDRRMTELIQATVTGPALARLTGHAAVTSTSKLRPGLAAYIGALPRGVGHMFSTYNLGVDPTQTDIHASLVGRGPRIFKGWHLGDLFTLGTRAHIAQNAPFWAMERAISQTYFAYDDALVELQQALGREPSGAELNQLALDKLNDPHYIATIEPRVRDAAYGAGMMGKTSTATKLLSQAIGMAKVPASVPAIGGFPFLKAFVPFMGIADRIAVMALQRMPGFAIAGGIVTGHPELAGMGLAVEAINELNAIRNGDDAKASYQAARQLWAIAIGIPILGAVSALAAQGLITGSAPAKKSDYDQWIATGKQPFSVKINQTWYRWDWLEPVAFMLKLALSAEGAWNDPNAQTPDAKLLEFAGRAGKAVSDSTYLRAFGMVISAIANPGTPVANAVESTLVAIGNPMSGLSRQIAATIDPLQRGTTNVVEALKATVPWLSQELPPKRDIYGATVPNADDPLFPWKGVKERPNPVADAFAEVQSHVPNFAMPAAETAKVGKDLKLDGHELIRFQELAGQAIYQQAQKVIDSQRYKGLGWDQRAKELEAAIREGHTLGKQQLARELMGIHLDPATGAPQYGTASPREKALAIGIGLSAAPGNYERLKLVSEWLPIVDKDPALADALDKQLRAASTQFASDGKLTLADFKKVAPYLPALEKIPEFEEGTPAQWNQYHAELAEYNRLNLLDPTHDRANAFRDTHPVLDNFMYLSTHGGKNPGLADLIEQQPLIRRITLPRDRT